MLKLHQLTPLGKSLDPWNEISEMFFIGNGFLLCSNISHGYGLALRVSDGERLLLIFEDYKEKCDSTEGFVRKYIVILLLVVLVMASIRITISVAHR